MNSMKSCGDKTGVRKFTIVGSCEMGHFHSLLFIPLFTLPFLHISTFLLYSIKLINAQPTICIWSSSNIFDKNPWHYSNTWKWLISEEQEPNYYKMTLKTKTNSPLRKPNLSETISIIKSTSKSSKLSSRVILKIKKGRFYEPAFEIILSPCIRGLNTKFQIFITHTDH